MMVEADFYDAAYFGHVPVIYHKSNYSRVGGYREEVSGAREWAQYVRKRLKELFPDRDTVRVLEVGCAHGYSVLRMRELGMEAYGVDFSPYVLSTLPDEAKPYVGYGDARDLQSSEFAQSHAPYDVVVSKDVLEHFTEEELKSVLKGMAKLAPYQIHQV
ncbi:MAG: class I SAM-dependent methyltransferase, partial [Candidatus Methanomethylicaceae archaeon]